MKDRLISFETSVLAKQKGFFEGFLLYRTDGTTWNTFLISDEERKLTSACTQSVLHKWLRECKGIDIDVRCQRVIRSSKAQGYSLTIYTPTTEVFNWNLGGTHDVYEDALEYGLIEALKLIE